MVLDRRWRGLLLTAFLLVSASACISTAPTQRLAKPTLIAVAYVHDHGQALAPVPAQLLAEVQDILQERNLVGSAIDGARAASEFERKRATTDRLETMAGHVGAAELMLLVEIRAQYFSQINGRYRWTVYAKLSMAKVGEPGEARTTSFDVPVALLFNHQREQEAIANAAEPIARKLGQQVDDFLAGLDLETQKPAVTRGADEPGLGPIYFVMLDRFTNGDSSNDGASADPSDPQGFHGGDLRGLIGKLDYIRDLGFKTLWLAPIFAMRTEKIGEHGAFHGYWTEDLQLLEPRFGTEEDLLELKEALSARGMTLVLDMVLNHVGYETRLVSEKPNWFHKLGNVQDWDDPVQLTTHDVHGLPDLDQNNPEVYRYLVDASVQWIEVLAPVGFRLDAVKHVGDEFWRRYTSDIERRAGPSFKTIGELYNGNPSAIAAGFESGGFSHLFDFPLYFAMTEVFCKGEDARKLAATLSLDRLYADSTRLITFADNHDLPRVWSACGESAERVSALLSFMLTARGLPAFNYGTESALAGAGEPDNRRDMVFDASPRFAELIRRLLQARAEHPVLEKGTDSPLVVAAQHFAYVRRHGQAAAIVVVNTGAQAWSYRPGFSVSGALDVLSGSVHGDGDVVVPPNSVRTLILPAERVKIPASGQRKVVVVAEAEGASELFLVGGGPELGSWEPKAAPRGKRLGDGRFQFDLTLPVQGVCAFKLVRDRRGALDWEQRDNRYLVVGDATDATLALQFEGGN